MAQPQSRLSLERELMGQIRQEQISSPEQFNAAVMMVFDGVIGSFGRGEFEQYVLPKLLLRYRANYGAAGRRALQIIEEGSYKNRGEIADYFKNALGAPDPRVEKRTSKATRKVRGRVEESKSKDHEYKPQLNRYPEFSPLASQDRLREGFLRTVDRGYIRISGIYSIDTTNRLHYFGWEQNRLHEGLIKFRHLNTKGGKSEWSV